MMTRLAPARMWAAALSRLVSLPVHSITTSMPSSRQGRSSAFDSISMVTAMGPTIILSCSRVTGSGKRPCTESRASSRASASGSPRSFTATTSIASRRLHAPPGATPAPYDQIR